MAQASATQPYVFLSYASADRERALAIADALEKAGVRVWVDRRSIVGGSSWDAEIVRGIKECSGLLVACTEAAMASVNVQQEIRLALEERRPIVPLMLEPVTFPDQVRYALAGRQWVELLDRPSEAWVADVRRALAGFGLSTHDTRSPPGDVAAAHPQPSAAPVSISATNLPAALSSFVGREQEVADVTRLLETARLVTLTGPGGTGKTRLALAAAQQVQARYRDGVWFVDLSPITDPSLVLSSIARVLSVREGEGQSLTDALKVYLREKRLLLVLDNFEQVIESASLVSDLLAGTAYLALLVTSRILLRIAGEKEYAVLPLRLPGATTSSLAMLADTAAVALFVQRAEAAKPNFTLTEANATAVAKICTRLDGLPLALELAAARLRILSPEALLARLDQRLRLLTGGARSLPQRQQTLRDTIAWSYDLLTLDEKTLFRRLSVFAGGCTLETAERVCNAAGMISIDLLDGLQSLVEQSLLRVHDGPEGERRFFLLETIREYGGERLTESDEQPSLQHRHACVFLEMIEVPREARSGAAEQAWAAHVDREHDNLRMALETALEAGSNEMAARLGGSLWRFWELRGYWSEGRSWLARILESTGDSPPRARATVAQGAGTLALMQGDYVEAQRFLEHALALARDVGDSHLVGAVLNNLANVAIRQGDYETARVRHEDVLAMRQDLGDAEGIATSLNNLGVIAHDQGDYVHARTLYEEALAARRGQGANSSIAVLLTNLAWVAYMEGALDEARDHHERSLSMRRQLGMSNQIAAPLEGLALVSGAAGQPERAAILLAAAAALRDEIGAPLPSDERAEHDQILALVRSQLGDVAFAAAYAEGRALSLDAAITLALEQTARVPS